MIQSIISAQAQKSAHMLQHMLQIWLSQDRKPGHTQNMLTSLDFPSSSLGHLG
jgi:hypothetical protein